MKRKGFSAGLLAALVLFAFLFSPACNKKQIADLTQQTQTLEGKNADLQKELTAKESAVTQLEKEKSALQAELPESYDVKSGDTHWKIAYDYLVTKKGVPEDKAKEILWQTPLDSEILVGNRVWNFYLDGVFGTVVTQGNAPVSPAALMRQAQRRAAEEKARLEGVIGEQKAEIGKLNSDIAEKDQENTALKAQADTIPGLKKDIADLTTENQASEARLNSIYYLVGSKSSLKAAGKIKGSFLGLCGTRIDHVTSADFAKSLDLRSSSAIDIQAADVGLARIKKVELLPWRFDKAKDYQVEIEAGGRTARVVLLGVDKFKMAQIVLVVD
jgi:cell division protein FtsB